MKKLYLFLTMLLVCIGQISAKEVTLSNIKESQLSSMEFRDGGADGTVITPDVSGYYPKLSFEQGLYMRCINPDVTYMFVSIYVDGGAQEKEIAEDWSCYYTMEELENISSITLIIKVPLKIKVNVEDPSVVVFKPGSDGEPFEAIAGENIFKVPDGEGFYITVADPSTHKLTRFYNVTQNSESTVYNFTYASVSSFYLKDGDEFAYTVVPVSEFTQPKLKIRVDDPEHADISLDSNYLKNLEANVWTEVEMGAFSQSLSVRHKSYSDEIYMVTLNGTPLTAGYYGFSATVKDGDEVDVTVNPEPIDYTVTISVNPEEAAGVITEVAVAGEDQDHLTGEFTVRNGKKIKMYFDYDFYTLGDVVINGEKVTDYIYSNYEYKVTGDTEIVVNATKKPVNTIIIDIDHPESLTCKIYYDNVKLVEGENVIEYLPNKNSISFATTIGATMEYFAFEKDGVTVEPEVPDGSWSGDLDESFTKFVIRVNPLVIDKQMVVYFDATEEVLDNFYNKSGYGVFSFYSPNAGQSAYYTYMKSGYDTIDFADVYLPYYWRFTVYNSDEEAKYTEGKCYLNGTLVETRDYSGIYVDEIPDGSVLKFYIMKDPETFSATITADEDVEFSVVKDLIVNIEDYDQPVTDLEGTEIEIIPAEEGTLRIIVTPAEIAMEDEPVVDNENVLAPDEDGRYIVVLDGNKDIRIEKQTTNGIGIAEKAVAPRNVYNTMGVLMVSDASDEDIQRLPAGIYIVGGKKIVKK